MMLGTFPPGRERWCMDFFYPNFQNDMWRIFGAAFFGDPQYFVAEGKKAFDKARIENFLRIKKIALYDTAVSVRRLRGNASDAFLEICEPLDLASALARLPECLSIAATGKKAADTLAEICKARAPNIGESVRVKFAGREFDFYKMPSSSRAYPKPLSQKAQLYAEMFKRAGIL